jgi:hypothetical protein
MESPNVVNKLIDRASGVTYVVMAYRALTASELRLTVAAYLRQQGPAKRGQEVVIQTSLGL